MEASQKNKETVAEIINLMNLKGYTVKDALEILSVTSSRIQSTSTVCKVPSENNNASII